MDKLSKCKCGGKARYREKGEYCWVECRKCGKKTGYYPNPRLTMKTLTMTELLVHEWEKVRNVR